VRRFFKRWHLHPLERVQAAATLHSMGDEEGTRFLRESLTSPRPEARGFALELSGKLKLPGALDLLQGVLADPEDPHHLDAVRGLGHLGDQRSLPTLDRLAKQRGDPQLADVALQAAEQIRSRKE
jgi:HEAT repeat protein